MTQYVLPDGLAVSPDFQFPHSDPELGDLVTAIRDMTPEQRAARGITEAAPAEPEAPFDGRFYFMPGSPRGVDDCRAVHARAVDAFVSTTLAQTDWTITRAAEGYKAAPPAVLDYRRAVRGRGNELVAELAAISTVTELAVWQASGWPVDPNAPLRN